VAFELGFMQLGGRVLHLGSDEVGVGKRQAVKDAARNLSRWVDAIMARVHRHQTALELAEHATVPVINGLTDFEHPCQALSDYFTLHEHKGTLADITLAWVGDGNNVARSLTLACALAGVDIRLACPAGHQPDPVAVDGARARGVQVTVTVDPIEAVTGADAVCTDVWVSMGQEAEQGAREDAFAGYQVDEKLMEAAAPSAVFLHCLPAHRGSEVSAAVIDGPASLVFDQAENRMHSTRGLLLWLVQESSCS